MQRLLGVLHTHRNRQPCLVALFLISTGARLNEALTATWEQIDLEGRTWRIPAKNSKSGRVRAVPLNDSALGVLEELGQEGRVGPLFVNRRTGKQLATLHTAWRVIREAAGLPDLRIHDLRHQFASFLVNSGRSLFELQKVLGHSSPTVTQRYAHLSTRTLQDAAASADAKLKAAAPRQPTS